MSKKRLPPKVHEKGGRYYFVDKNKWTALSKVDEGARELHRRLATLTHQSPNTMAAIFAAFADSPGFAKLSASTRKQYSLFLFGILDHCFGHMLPSEFDDGTIAIYLQKREDEGAAVSGNRERSCLSSAFNFAMRQGLAKRNPCRGVRRNKETASKVDIETADLTATIDSAPPHYARVLRLAYLTGIREVDLIALRVQDVGPDGLTYTESKTGKRVLMQWSDELRECIREILEARAERINRPYANKSKKPRIKQTHDFLLINRLGDPLTVWGQQSNARRKLPGDWTFRAIRPKAQTDAGDDRNVLGHAGQMRERYTRRRKLVPVR